MLTDLIGTDSVAVLFEVPKDILVERIVNRRSCKKCGEIFNLKFKAPKTENTCDKCGAVGLTHRDDDKEETVAKRLSVFDTDGAPVVDYYKNVLKNLIVVNANQDMETVLREFHSQVLKD
jgi:adenylate kinase